MGIYTGNSISNSFDGRRSFLQEAEEITELSIHESPLTGMMENITLTNRNWAAIHEAIGVAELNCLEESGQEMLYEGGKLAGFFEKIKSFFRSIWEKIVKVFKKFIAMMDQFVKSDKEFVKKYRPILNKLNLKDFEFNGYEFTISGKPTAGSLKNILTRNADKDDLGKVIAKVKSNTELSKEDMENAKSILDKLDSDKENEIKEESRGECIGKGKLDASEFQEELFAFFRNGKDSKETLDNIDINKQLNLIEGYKEAKKVADKDLSDTKKAIDDIIKEIDDLGKAASKDTTEGNSDKNSLIMKTASRVSTIYKDGLEIIQTYMGAKLSALKAENRQAKAICVKAVGYKPQNSSTVMESSTDFLGGVQLV